MVIFVLKRRKLFNVKYLPLFHHFKAIYQFPKLIIVLVKIVANVSLSKNISIQKPIFPGSNYTIQYGHHYLINILKCQYDLHYCNLITICWLIRIYGYSVHRKIKFRKKRGKYWKINVIYTKKWLLVMTAYIEKLSSGRNEENIERLMLYISKNDY
jgi:hypothetical protein